MAETKADIRAQLQYMRDNKQEYLQNITERDYYRRIKTLRAMLEESL